MTTAQVNQKIDAEAMIAEPIATCLVTFDIVLSFHTRSLLRAAHNPFHSIYTTLSSYSQRKGRHEAALSIDETFLFPGRDSLFVMGKWHGIPCHTRHKGSLFVMGNRLEFPAGSAVDTYLGHHVQRVGNFFSSDNWRWSKSYQDGLGRKTIACPSQCPRNIAFRVGYHRSQVVIALSAGTHYCSISLTENSRVMMGAGPSPS
jgi:hypothetical protein